MALFSDLLVTEHWLVRSRMLLRTSAEYVGDFMNFHNIPFYRPVAGVFVFARLGGHSATKDSDAALWKQLSAAGVALAYGAALHNEELGWFRLTFAIPKEQMFEGLRRIETGLKAKRRYQPEKDQLVTDTQVNSVRSKERITPIAMLYHVVSIVWRAWKH